MTTASPPSSASADHQHKVDLSSAAHQASKAESTDLRPPFINLQNTPTGTSSRACDECRFRKIRCNNITGTCESCAKKNLPCTYRNPVMKRGPKVKNPQANGNHSAKKAAISVDALEAFATSHNSSLLRSAPKARPISPQRSSRQNTSPYPPITSSIPPPAPGFNNSPTLQSHMMVKSDSFGCLNVHIDPSGFKAAEFYLRETPDPFLPHKHTLVATTSLENHPLAFIDASACDSYRILKIMTSQQIYILLVFFGKLAPKFPKFNVSSFVKQLKGQMTPPLLFLLNAVCAVACKEASNSRAHFDFTQFHYKALEVYYYYGQDQSHENWAQGHSILKTLAPPL
ncbi:hypothetical protein CONCODRAFT_80441 [Conidiobolus coronatus NRRL 28638]|uniref:Zn(2)-C6 fungal-type domain-containing protein n=1 Tax=Conidiobolus coronatus (strain ATCC 28846 / CBS 209.66 / NRRL 28638) TaxID=796925 RepID=A0A137NVK3_CONC2|nr:hypothetical protein CONCODRAFT_80441 [Conidiobolus coronatus NRRL 28638]|eukprot:KXN66624.1 hypothetical protein CONCODRAFT_80441 [Conidiobolus coronatus NRRL 28638]